ncbi:MAG: hypothetical protein V3U65_08695 [Granulosicoccaceae bacterium]
MTKFTANIVEIFKNEFTPEFVVFNLLFEESDPEEGGESWCFQRALGADGTIKSLEGDDDGVCTVKEIQQAILHEGIQMLELSKTQLVCVFEPQAVAETGTEGLEINYQLDDKLWNELKEMSSLVFTGKNFFTII